MKKQVFIEYDADHKAAAAGLKLPAANEEIVPTVEAQEAPPVVDSPETGMRKHRRNIMPDMSPEMHEALRANMLKNGYDKLNFPITVASDGTFTNGVKNYNLVVDGWNRWMVCQELNLTPSFKHFEGNDEAVLDFVFKSNTRRNLTSDQWACLVTEYKEIHKELVEQAKENQAKSQFKNGKNTVSHKNDTPSGTPKKAGRTDEKIIKELNAETNRTKVAKTNKLNKENPEVFKEVKDGKITINDAIRNEKTKALADQPKTLTVAGESFSKELNKIIESKEALVADIELKEPVMELPERISESLLATMVRNYRDDFLGIDAVEDKHVKTPKNAAKYGDMKTKLLYAMAKTLFYDSIF